MTRSKRILSMVIAMVMCIGMLQMYGVAADGTTGFDNFAAQNTFESATFTDISEDDWYYGDVKAVYELGLMIGDENNAFTPASSVTVAQAITIAARLNSIYVNGTDEFEAGETWYDSYVAYAKENGILTFEVEDLGAPAKRSEFALIMANALPTEALEAVNTVADGAIPDVADDAEYADAVYALYRAGIIIGNDELGTFAPDTEIQRCAVAAITARMAYTELRKEVTLGDVAEDTTAPEAETTAPEAETTAPEAETTAPEAETTAPEAETTAPEAETTAPEAETTAPEAETTAPEADKEALKELILSFVGEQLAKEEETTAPEEELFEITAAALTVNGTVASTVKVGDVITFTATPADATGLITWTVGGVEIPNHTAEYTVTALDMGKTVKAEIFGDGDYTGIASAECTVESEVQLTAQDIMNDEADEAPVVLASTVTFLDENKNEVTVNPNDTLTLTIGATEDVDAADLEVKVEAVAGQILADNVGVSAKDIEDLTVAAVDVDLAVNDTPVHPVGEVTVTLSATQLGLPEGTDLSLYSFTANHTNKNDVEENVAGELITIDGVQYISFTLNGLSTIWIGNIPPRTVSFYLSEEDADNKANSIGSVEVKFGDLTPTMQIPTPSLEGNIFCGWNYDLTRTPIITNLEVHATWIEGEKMPRDSFYLEFTEETEKLHFEVDDGMITMDADEPIGLPSNLAAAVYLTAPENAVKYFVCDSASLVAEETKESDYTAINPDAELFFEFTIADENGVIISSSYTYYYKWVDAEGEIISVQEIKVKIANGSATATSRVYDVEVNRGVGTFEGYLLDNDDETKTYVGYINNSLYGYFVDGYTLESDLSFDGYRVNNNCLPYDEIKLVFTAFDGESFSEDDEITASGMYWHYDKETNNGDAVTWNGTYEIVEGQLIVTYPFDVKAMNEDYANATVSVNGVEQYIYIRWDHAEEIYGEEDDGEDITPPEIESIDIVCETWAEVLEALETVEADANIFYYIYCSDESAITLSSSLTLPANVDLYLNNCPSFTVANGAVLTLTDYHGIDDSSTLRIRRGTFIVEDGGTLASATTIVNGSRTYPSLLAKNLTFKSGSRMLLPTDALISLRPSNYGDEPELAFITFEKGSTVNSAGQILIHNFDTVNLNGTFNSTNYTDITSDEINISGSVNFTSDKYARFEIYGTINIAETGSVVANNINPRSHRRLLEMYGPLTNKGTIEVKGGGYAEIMNNGFAIYNMGTISVGAECEIHTTGTKFINTGLINGEGTIYAQLGDDYTNYEDGLEYIEAEGEEEYYDEELDRWVYNLMNYSRYMYTYDPAPMAKVLIYRSEIANIGDGECTAEVVLEDFPEINDDGE